MYDIRTNYYGTPVILHSDPDRLVFINRDSICYENGVPFSLEEKIEFLKYCGKNKRSDIGFMDGQERYHGGYGLCIEFDGNGDPKIKIEDGKILSTRVICVCEERLGTNFLLNTKEKYDSFREELVSSGIFSFVGTVKNDQFYKFPENRQRLYEYKCNLCGEIYQLPAPIHRYGIFVMNNKKHHEAYLKSIGEDKASVRKRRIRIVLLSVAVIITLFLFVSLAVMWS